MPWWGYLIIAVVAIAIVITLVATGNGKKLKAWLAVAVDEAEKALGGGTGPIKLKRVYDEFINKFPIISKVISYETFCKLVDKALIKLGLLLKDNQEKKEEETN